MSNEHSLVGRDFDGIRLSIRTPQVRQVLHGLQQVSLAPTATPKVMKVGWDEIDIPDDWFDALSSSNDRMMTAKWGRARRLYVERGEIVSAANYTCVARLDVIYRLLEDVPFTEAVFPNGYDEWSERLDGNWRYTPPRLRRRPRHARLGVRLQGRRPLTPGLEALARLWPLASASRPR